MEDAMTTNMRVQGNVPAPLAISEIVLQTARFDEMQAWYETVLSTKPAYEYSADDVTEVNPDDRVLGYERLCFLRIQMDFPYSQVLAIFQVPKVGENRGGPGLHHMQFRQGNILDLVTRVEILAEMGIRPARCFNHGPSTSFYFEDPDGNSVEISGPNVSSQEEYSAFFQTPAFRRNPNGVPIDAEDFCRRYRAGDRTVLEMPAD